MRNIVLVQSANTKGAILIASILLASLGLLILADGQLLTEQSMDKALYHRTTALTAAPAVLDTPFVSNDTNWAGYVVASDLQNPQPTVTSISASWTVPKVVTSFQDEFSAVWIGIGGFFDNSLIQTGTEQDSIQGQSEYSAWLELLPQTSLTIDTITVSPGDQISASILLVDSTIDEWTIDIKDLTTNQEYTNSFVYPSSQMSAEWIVERPEITSTQSRGTLANLANIGNVLLTNCQASIGGKSGSIASFPTVESVMYSSVDNTSGSGMTQLAAVSDLLSNGSSFSVETSPLVVPEMSIYTGFALVIGTSLLVVINKHSRFALKK